jgi:hypothetical protein
MTMEQKAIGLLNALERAGKSVVRVTIEGKKIEVELAVNGSEASDQFEGLNLRHDKA